MPTLNLNTLLIRDYDDLNIYIEEFKKAIKEKNSKRIAECVRVWNNVEEHINYLILKHQELCDDEDRENEYITFLSKNVDYINKSSEEILNQLKQSQRTFNKELYYVHKNSFEKDILKEYTYYEFKNRIKNIEESVLKLYEKVKVQMKSIVVEEFAWIETYVKNCIDSEDKKFIEQHLKNISQNENDNIKTMQEITNHIKSKINKNVENLGLKNKNKTYKVFNEKGEYNAMSGSGRPDVVLRKNDGGIAFTYANHFQNTYMESDQAERHSGIILETEYRYQQKQKNENTKGVTWGEIFDNVNNEYKGIEGQRENYKRINNLNTSKAQEEKEQYLEYQKYGQKMTISSYQNLDSSAKKIQNMIISVIEETTGEKVTKEDKRVEKMVAVHQGIMIMAQDFNNGIYSVKENEDDMITLEGSNLFDNDNIKIYGPSMRREFSRKELYKEIREMFLDPKIIENSLGIIKYTKISQKELSYQEDSLTFNNEMNLLKPGKTTVSKNGFSVKKADLEKVGKENTQMYSLYMLFAINSMVQEQMKGVFETIVNRIIERVKELTQNSEELKIKAQDVRNLVEEMQAITGKNKKNKLNTMLQLIIVWGDLEVAQENLEVAQENLKVKKIITEFLEAEDDKEYEEIIKIIIDKQLSIKSIYEGFKKQKSKDKFVIKLCSYLQKLPQEEIKIFLERIKNDIDMIQILLDVLKNYKGEKKILEDLLEKRKNG